MAKTTGSAFRAHTTNFSDAKGAARARAPLVDNRAVVAKNVEIPQEPLDSQAFDDGAALNVDLLQEAMRDRGNLADVLSAILQKEDEAKDTVLANLR